MKFELSLEEQGILSDLEISLKERKFKNLKNELKEARVLAEAEVRAKNFLNDFQVPYSVDRIVAEYKDRVLFKGLAEEDIAFIKGWSLGAFLGGWIWTLASGLYWYTLGSFVPFWSFYLQFKLLVHGREIAWERSDYGKSIEDFKRRERILLYIFLALLALTILFLIVPLL